MKSTLTSEFRAEELCGELVALLKKEGRQEATVHSVFKTSLNLLSSGRLVTLLSGSRPLYPYSVRLQSERLPALAPGDRVLMDEHEFLLPKGGRIRLSGASVGALSLTRYSRETLSSPTEERLRELRAVLLQKGKPDGFLPLLTLLEPGESPLESNLYADFAAARIPALFEAVRQNDPEAAGKAAYSIAGCGIGLTPSADDFLTGLMASLFMEAHKRDELTRITPLLTAIANAAAPRTNLISGTFLMEAAAGLTSRDTGELLQTLYTCVLSQGITPSAMNVIAFGETSGTDILIGIYFGQKIYPN